MSVLASLALPAPQSATAGIGMSPGATNISNGSGAQQFGITSVPQVAPTINGNVSTAPATNPYSGIYRTINGYY